MCCLFGFYNYSGQPIKNISHLTNCLAEEATVRGIDATGIAYNHKNKLVIHKEAKSAYQMDLKHPSDTVCVTCHTRHATQGDKKKNYNNHPFSGVCENAKFALCHNGVLTNDCKLRKELHLPHTKIETDSFIAVQLIEKNTMLNSENIKFMAEKIKGSFAFSILDTDNTLWLIRGDSPLSLIHIPKYKLYVYASTDEILYRALVDTNLFKEIKTGNFDEISVNSGDIIRIKTDGIVYKDNFEYKEYLPYSHWWEYGLNDDLYIAELKAAAKYQGYSSEDIDTLLQSGCTPEEIEEYIYCME